MSTEKRRSFFAVFYDNLLRRKASTTPPTASPRKLGFESMQERILLSVNPLSYPIDAEEDTAMVAPEQAMQQSDESVSLVLDGMHLILSDKEGEETVPIAGLRPLTKADKIIEEELPEIMMMSSGCGGGNGDITSLTVSGTTVWEEGTRNSTKSSYVDFYIESTQDPECDAVVQMTGSAVWGEDYELEFMYNGGDSACGSPACDFFAYWLDYDDSTFHLGFHGGGGTREAQIRLHVLNDALPEGDEDVTMNIMWLNDSGCESGCGSGETWSSISSSPVTIKDDDNWIMSSTVETDIAREPCSCHTLEERSGTFEIKRTPGDDNCTDDSYGITVEFTLEGTASPPGTVGGSDFYLTTTIDGLGQNLAGVYYDQVEECWKGTVVIPAFEDSVILYVVPVDDLVYDADETVILTIVDAWAQPGHSFTLGSNLGGTVEIWQMPEFISDVDEDNDPDLPIPINSDFYQSYIRKSAAAGEEITTLNPIYALSSGTVTYSIISGNELGLFEIDSSTGVITAAVSLANVENLPSTITLGIASVRQGPGGCVITGFPGTGGGGGTGTVTVSTLDFGFVPYTPETKNIAPMEIPKEKWKTNDVGIRRNGDFDDGKAVPDWWSGTASAKENDLIRVDINLPSVAGVVYYVRSTVEAPEVRLWSSKSKGGLPIKTVDGGTLLTSSITVYAEYILAGDSEVTFELVAMDARTSKQLMSEKIVFRPFDSVTCAFVGENQTAGNTAASPGVNEWVEHELLNGYDVHVWDDGHDWFRSDDCDEWGKGPALDEIANAVNNRGVTEVAALGYSHGGGTVYNLSKRLNFDGQSCIWYGKTVTFEQMIQKPFKLVFTSYIDAIRNDKFTRMLAEDQRPWDSSFHVNQYQQNTFYSFFGQWALNGAQSMPIGNIDENVSDLLDANGSPLDHGTIDDCLEVWNEITIPFESLVSR